VQASGVMSDERNKKMRFMMIGRPQFQIPIELLPTLVDGFSAWWDQYQDRWVAAGFYAGVNGGGGICEVADEAEFNRMMLEWPLMAFSEVESYPLVEMDTALTQWKEFVATMMPDQPHS
jgi:hypothetical protein